MQLKSISLRLDGHYVATLDGSQENDIRLVSKSLDELHSMINECVDDAEEMHEADKVLDGFLESLINDAVANLNTLHAKFRLVAA
jgi:hypothetical protein